MSMRITITTALAAGLTLALLAGCTTGGEIDNPVQRRATWISFISGEDIAASCAANGREHYRLTYYADRDIQVRVYDVEQTGDPAAQLRARVLQVAANAWFPWPLFEDPSRPFRPYDRVSDLSDVQLAAIRTNLAESGLGTRPPPVDRKLASHSYFWLAAGCRDGEFAFQAWEYPDPDFAALDFPEILFEADATAIPVEPTPADGKRRTYNAFTGRTAGNQPADGRTRYNLRVDPRGVTLVH
jgi:hypothetical protein